MKEVTETESTKGVYYIPCVLPGTESALLELKNAYNFMSTMYGQQYILQTIVESKAGQCQADAAVQAGKAQAAATLCTAVGGMVGGLFSLGASAVAIGSMAVAEKSFAKDPELANAKSYQEKLGERLTQEPETLLSDTESNRSVYLDQDGQVLHGEVGKDFQEDDVQKVMRSDVETNKQVSKRLNELNTTQNFGAQSVTESAESATLTDEAVIGLTTDDEAKQLKGNVDQFVDKKTKELQTKLDGIYGKSKLAADAISALGGILNSGAQIGTAAFNEKHGQAQADEASAGVVLHMAQSIVDTEGQRSEKATQDAQQVIQTLLSINNASVYRGN